MISNIKSIRKRQIHVFMLDSHAITSICLCHTLEEKQFDIALVPLSKASKSFLFFPLKQSTLQYMSGYL